MEIRRGQVHMAYLDPAFGREIGGCKPRPVLVLSINDLHEGTRIAVVIPGTSTKSTYRNVVEVAASSENKLKNSTFFQCHQIRAVDQARLFGEVGNLEKEDLEKVERAVIHSLGLFAHSDVERLKQDVLGRNVQNKGNKS